MEDETARIQENATLSGHILIPAGTPQIERGVARVQLEELTGEDAPARVIAEVDLPDIRHPAGTGDTLIPFGISLNTKFVVDSRKDYALRVWIDHDGDGEHSAGDLYNHERQRVFSDDSSRPILIRVGR